MTFLISSASKSPILLLKGKFFIDVSENRLAFHCPV